MDETRARTDTEPFPPYYSRLLLSWSIPPCPCGTDLAQSSAMRRARNTHLQSCRSQWKFSKPCWGCLVTANPSKRTLWHRDADVDLPGQWHHENSSQFPLPFFPPLNFFDSNTDPNSYPSSLDTPSDNNAFANHKMTEHVSPSPYKWTSSQRRCRQSKLFSHPVRVHGWVQWLTLKPCWLIQ